MNIYIAQFLAMYLVILGAPAQISILCKSMLCFVTVTIGTMRTSAHAVTLLTCIRELHGSRLDAEFDANA